MNITDVDDRIITLAAEAGAGPADLHRRPHPLLRGGPGHGAHGAARASCRGPPSTSRRWSTSSRACIERGHTYTAEGSVYFRIATLPGVRPALAPRRRGHQGRRARGHRQVRQGERARLRALEGRRRTSRRGPSGTRPSAAGRPGLAHRVLGHEHEVPRRDASTCTAAAWTSSSRTTRTRSRRASAAPGKPFVRHWMHVEHLLVDNETMSKSKGNFFTIPDVLARGHRPEAIRYLLLRGPLPQPPELHLGGPAAGGGGPGAHPRPGPAAGGGGSRRARLAEASARPWSRPRPPSTPRSPTTSTRRRRWPPSTGWWARATRVLAAGDGDAGGRGAAARAARGDGQRVRACCCPRRRSASPPEEQALFDERQEARRRRDFGRADEARAGWRRWGSSSRTRRKGRDGGESGEGPAPAAARPRSAPGRRPGKTLACRHLEVARARGPGPQLPLPLRRGRRGGARRRHHGLRGGQGAGRATRTARATRRSPFGKRRRIVRAARHLRGLARACPSRRSASTWSSIDWADDGRPRIRHDAAPSTPTAAERRHVRAGQPHRVPGRDRGGLRAGRRAGGLAALQHRPQRAHAGRPRRARAASARRPRSDGA